MFLTRMPLNPSRRDTRGLLASPQRVHAAVLAGFGPTDGAHDLGRVLWRIDREASHDIVLWISSPTRPDLTGLQEQAGWPLLPDAWRTASLAPLYDRLAPDQRWAFRLTANPVVNRSSPAGRSQVVPHLTVAQQAQWLLSRVEQWGFEIPDASTGAPELMVHGRRDLRFSRRTRGTEDRVTLRVATFDGHLVVRDAARLRTALSQGLGRAKGYGCGLLTLAHP